MTTKRRVVAKVEWHPGEQHPRVGFIVTNLSRSAELSGISAYETEIRDAQRAGR